MSEILKGLTREQALGCINGRHSSTWGFFVYGGNVYSETEEIGLPFSTSVSTVEGWKKAINAYYDEQERPKWVEPEIHVACKVMYCDGNEKLMLPGSWHNADGDAHLRLLNARRKIEAFIGANGGDGSFFVMVQPDDGKFFIEDYDTVRVGCLSCATRELSEEVIRRFPAELALLAGLDGAK